MISLKDDIKVKTKKQLVIHVLPKIVSIDYTFDTLITTSFNNYQDFYFCKETNFA